MMKRHRRHQVSWTMVRYWRVEYIFRRSYVLLEKFWHWIASPLILFLREITDVVCWHSNRMWHRWICHYAYTPCHRCSARPHNLGCWDFDMMYRYQRVKQKFCDKFWIPFDDRLIFLRLVPQLSSPLSQGNWSSPCTASTFLILPLATTMRSVPSLVLYAYDSRAICLLWSRKQSDTLPYR